MNRFPDFVSLDSFYIGMRGVFQTHFVLEKADSDSTHRIRYHIEANVVSNVPIPASFYLFLSGLGLLAKYRQRKH